LFFFLSVFSLTCEKSQANKILLTKIFFIMKHETLIKIIDITSKIILTLVFFALFTLIFINA